MKNKDNTDFIKSIYESQKQDLPESLSKENIIAQLENTEIKPKTARIIPFRKIASVAAVFIVVICAVFAGGRIWEDRQIKSLISEDYAEIESHFLKLYNRYKTDELVNNYVDDALEGVWNVGADLIYGESFDKNASADTAVPEAGAPESNMAPTQAATQNSVTSNHGQTNVQVENVDEADVIKNDGKYIYVLTGSKKDNLYSGDVVHIIRGSDLEEVSTLSVERKENTLFQGKEMYVDGDKLIIIGVTAEVKVNFEMGIGEDGKNITGIVTYNDAMQSAVWTPGYVPGEDEYIHYGFSRAPEYETLTLVYDISDISKPELVSEKKQSGEYNTSRMINGVLYTVSDYSVYIGKTESENEVLDICVPKVNGERISAEDIDTKIDENSRSYTVITASDTASGDLSGASYAYLGNSEKVYCSADTLYFTYSDYSVLKQRQTTVINAIGLSKDKISKKAEGSVYGHINNQFSMDEYDGYLRIGTTGYNSATFKNESNLYVLDDELKLVGELEDIADNEEIKSVRFAGNKAYVVTFEQTDPLFVIDLSKPTEPKISGYVKLPGYSTYLHPVGADYLVGVGFGGSEESADLSALKVTLFDVSNPEKPKVVSNFEVCEASTEITQCDNHKALLYYPEKNLIGIPVKKRIFADTFREVYSYAMLEIKDGELGLKNGFVHQQDKTPVNGLFRGTYIDETVYTVSDNSICAFNLESGELIKKTEYK